MSDIENSPWVSETPKAIGSCLLQLLYGVAAIAVIMLFLRGSAWLAENVLGWVATIVVVVGLPLLALSIILSFFKTTRGFGGLGFILVSYSCGLYVWLFSLIVVKALWGIVAIVIGLFMVGIGVIPFAIIALALKGEWLSAGEVLGSATVVLVVRYLGYILIGTSEADEPYNPPPLPPEEWEVKDEAVPIEDEFSEDEIPDSLIPPESDEAEKLFEQGIYYLEQRETDKGIKCLTKAIAISPNHVLAHYSLGVAYARLGATSSALDEYDTLTDLSDEFASRLFDIIYPEET